MYIMNRQNKKRKESFNTICCVYFYSTHLYTSLGGMYQVKKRVHTRHIMYIII